MATIWYLSKYVTPPGAAKVGARGFLLLREFAKLGHKSVVITSDSNHLAASPAVHASRMHEVIDGVDVYWLRTRKYRGTRSLGRILSWFDFEWQVLRMPLPSLPHPDVIIVSSPSPLTILNGLRLRRHHGCKLVFEVRDIWPLVLVAVGGVSPRNPAVRFLAWVERLGYRSADLIVGTMPNLREHVADVGGAAHSVVCVPQGIDPALLGPPQSLERDYIDAYIPRNKFTVCHAGSIGADNAIETLLTCAREMKDREDIHFLLVGEGYLKEKFRASTKDLANVTFAPGIPKAAVQSLLARVDLVYFAVHKSPLMRFGQSLNKVIDYMLSGKPILASFTGYPSMINEAGCGSFVPAEDVHALRHEIERYAAMPKEQRERLGARGRSWLLEHRVYDKLAAGYLWHMQIAEPATP